MIYQDAIYGSHQITEPVLEALMETAALQRLQGVLQHGISALIGVTTPITRFEHSVGAMLLVRRLGGTLEEQIAALLHDVSHTAFSHVIDYVFNGHNSQSYHDDRKAEYLAQTDIPAVLAEYGYDWNQFVHEEDFSLLEQPSPRLCADRLDYFLRDSQGLNLATPADIQNVLDHLVVVDERIAADDLQAARWLGYTFIKADDASWANFREVGLYELTAQAIRRGMEIGLISEADFWGTDRPLWAKMHACRDIEMQKLLRLISPATQFVWDDDEATFQVSTKLRAIDPDVALAEDLRPLSALDPAFARHRADYIAGKQGMWSMRVIPAF
ncbi:MAG: HD domain-containing protein [Anaerolineales bacterium]|nr:HD domain-containing protein [Anaerolineales bacterium]MCB8966008.1 HD domain-containing protein [Ardenticatenaceae bacterium]